MVDISDLNKASQLVQQKRSMQRALDAFDQGVRITALELGGTEGASFMNGIAVSTWDIEYPESMVEALKQALRQRVDAIQSELTGLGVTGFEEGEAR